MSYSKQNFRSGDTLYASQLNAMDDEIAALEAEVESTKNMVGSPLTASTAAGMTDQTKIYVYTGTETGYTTGHWYYYNGTAWTDGGVYNSVAVNTDTSLTVSGQAADSKAVGDAIDEIDGDLSDVKSDLSQLESGFNEAIGSEEKHENVSVTTGKGVRISNGDVENLGVTTWSVSDLYEIPTGTTKIVSNFENGNVGSQNYGFAVYDENKTFVVGGHDPSALSIGSNHKYIRMTDYKANSDHSGLYINFEVGNRKLINRIEGIEDDLSDLSDLSNIKAATSADIGKSLSPKTVVDGTVTEWQYVECGGSGGDSSDYDGILVDVLSPVLSETGKYASSSSGKVSLYNVSASSVKKYDVSDLIGDTVYFTSVKNASPNNAYVMIADANDNFLASYINASHESETNQTIMIPENAKWFYLNCLATSAEDSRAIINIQGSILDEIKENVTAKSSGAICDFHAEKGSDVPRVEITNTSGTTVSSFTCVNSGRNMLAWSFKTATTKSGVTFTPNDDGSVTVNGTATANVYITYGTLYVPINDGNKFKLTGCPKNGGSSRFRMYLTASGTAVYDYGEGAEFTASGQQLSLLIYIPNGATCSNLVFKPMVTHNDHNDEYETPNTVAWGLSLSTNLLDGKTAAIEDGHIYIDGTYISDTNKITSKENYSHFWVYSTSKTFSVRTASYEDLSYVNDEIIYLNGIHSPYINLKGKSVVTYGDSLTYYDGNNFTWGNLQGTYCYGYQHYLRRVLGMLTTNRGVSGETTAQYCARVKQANDLTSYDYLFMMGGDNDDRLNASIGTLQPVGGTFDTTTVIGALQSAIEYALTANPNIRIILMTPPMGWTYQNDALDRVSVLIPNAYRQVAEQYGLLLIDLYKESGINELTRNTYYLDPPDTENNQYMYHPNNDGWKRISRIIIAKLAST